MNKNKSLVPLAVILYRLVEYTKIVSQRGVLPCVA